MHRLTKIWWAAAVVGVIGVGISSVQPVQRDLRWLERPSEERREWTQARSAEAVSWVEADRRVERWAAALATPMEQTPAVLLDHQAGSTLWQVRDGDRWRVVILENGRETELPLPIGTLDRSRVCAGELSPSGRAVVWGRRLPVTGVCRLLWMRREDGHTVSLGGKHTQQAVFDSLDRLWLAAQSRRKGGKSTSVRRVSPEGRLESVVEHRWGWLRPIPLEDSRVLWVHHRKGSPRLRIDSGPWTPLPKGRWEVLGVRSGAYVMSLGTGADRRVVAIDPERPEPDAWTTLLRASPGREIVAVGLQGDTLLVAQRGEGTVRLSGDAHLEALPPVAHVLFSGTTRDEAVLYTNSPEGSRVWVRSREDGVLTELPVRAPIHGTYHTDQALSADGTTIPMTWVRPLTLGEGERAPVWLQVYGGFGVSVRLQIGEAEALWLERGGIVAAVHARGGVERGPTWHESARRLGLERTIEDVEAAAEWFVEQGWTTEGRVAVEGGSNGGLTALAAVGRRPDLFGAALSHAGVTDLFRRPQFDPHWNPSEYGDHGDPLQEAVWRRMSPVALRPDRVPPIWLTSGVEDPTVSPVHSYKLRAAWGGLAGGPVLLRVQPWTSHAHHLSKEERRGAGPTRKQRRRVDAERLAFLGRVFGVSAAAPP